jgi:hypothetical protein
MGRGGEKLITEVQPAGLVRRNSWSFGKLTDLKDDLSTLRHLWFSNLKPKSGKDHAARLEAFYGPQAAACARGAGARGP